MCSGTRLGISEEETHYRADRPIHLFSTLTSSTCCGPAGVQGLGAVIPDKMAMPVTGQTFPEPLQPSLPCPSWWVWTIWGNRRRWEEGSESVFLSLSSVPVGFLQVTSSPLNDLLSAYFIMLYQNVHFFHRTIFSGETFRCYLSLDLNILTFVKWLNKTIFVSLLLLGNTSLQVMMSKQVSLGMHICGVMVSYSFLTKRWEI